MKINIILPYNTWGGAFRSTYELANHLVSRNNDVQLMIPFVPYLEGHSVSELKGVQTLARGLVRSVVRWNRVPWFDLKAPMRVIPACTDAFVRDADVVMANHWPTAFSVAKLSPRKGRKFYFIRDADRWLRHQREIQSFRLPLKKIVVAPWLKEYLENVIGVDVAGVVGNGTNVDLFDVPQKTYNAAPVICMCYYDHPQKGMDDGFAVLRAIKAKYPQVKVVLFGWKKPKTCPVEAEFHLRPVKNRLRDIYARSDIFICPSVQEGYHNPPREAMAAKCAVVATNVGCIPHVTIPGETALVVEPGDVEGMTRAVSSLVENPGRIQELGRRGHEHIRQFRWENSTAELLRIFCNA